MICSFYFVWVVILVRIVRDLSHILKLESFQILRLALYFISYCSIFNDRLFCRRFFAPTLLLYHSVFRLSIGFWKVFQIFWSFFKPLDSRAAALNLSAAFLRQLAYYTTLSSFCQYLFSKFFDFFRGFSVISSMTAEKFGGFLVYHNFFDLSIRFFEKFRNFQFSHFAPAFPFFLPRQPRSAAFRNPLAL